MAMLQVTDLKVNYGVIQAIKGVSFEVNEGEVIALIGANGAGKTTILHTVTGLIAPKSGKIEFEGKEFWAFAKWKNYLKQKYGDYMQLPPKSERAWKHKPLEISFNTPPEGYER